MEITLPSGTVHRGPNGDVARGAGLEYIEATTGLTQAQVEHAITHRTNVVVENGEVRAIIGEGTDGTEKVILSIIGGTIVAASHQPVYNDDCGSTVNIDNDRGEEGNPEHTTREGKPVDQVSTLREIIKNPTRIVDAGSKRYYILKVGTNQVLMIATDRLSKAFQELVTSFKGGGRNNAFKTVDDAMSYIDSRHVDAETVYDANEDIDC